MDMDQTESDSKTSYLAGIDSIIASIDTIKDCIEKKFIFSRMSKGHLENAGILINNKVILLSRFFEEKGLAFFEVSPGSDMKLQVSSLLGANITFYLTYLSEKAANELISYDKLLNEAQGRGIMAKIRGLFSILATGSDVSPQQFQQLKKKLARYKNICDQIFNFSLEKDLYNAIALGFGVSDYLQHYIYKGSYLEEVLHSLGCDNVFEKLLENYGPHEKLEESKKTSKVKPLEEERDLLFNINEALLMIRDKEQSKYLKNRFNMTYSYCESENLSTEERVKQLSAVLSEIEAQLDREKEKEKHM